MKTIIEPNFIFVELPYSAKALAEKHLNGIYNKKRNMYRFPKNHYSLVELVKTFPDLQNNKEFMDLGRSIVATKHVFLEMKAREDSPFIKDERLRPYQRVDIDYLTRLPSAGIFSDPRTGKTPMSIILIKELGTKRNLVVSPASLIYNWEKEFQRWYPECKTFVASGTPKQREKLYDEFFDYKGIKVLIISKDTWKSDHIKFEIGTGLKYDTCFVDEAHYLRNYKTTQSKAIFGINADRKYAITGTPTVKASHEIWGILHFLFPDKYSSFWQFVDRYYKEEFDWMGHRQIGEVKLHRKQELEELIGFISVQRKRKDVMKWLPDKERQTFHVKMEGKQLKAYKEMAEDFMTGDLDAANVLTQLMRLRQICLDPRLVGIDAPSAKTKALLEYLENNKEPVVIMSMFTSYFELVKPEIEKLGLKVGMIHGRMSNQEKQRAAEDFQAGKTDVLLANIISAGTGFTLDVAEQILFLDKAWNPADNQQAEDRITPTTEEKNHKHTIISLVCDDSVDERINEILENKQSLTDVINNGGHEAIKRLLS